MGILKEILIAIKSVKENQKKVQSYLSLPTQELAKLDDDALMDVLDTTLYFDVTWESIDSLNEEQLIVTTILQFDREIQNGGLCQFFVNSSRYFASFVSTSLERINATKIHTLFNTFISTNNINVSSLDSFEIFDSDDFETQYKRYPFGIFDNTYMKLYESENLETLLLNYVRKNNKNVFNFNNQYTLVKR